MKLSEAIRLGAMLTPQGYGPSSIVSRDAACALGGALEAIGRQPEGHPAMAFCILLEEWPWISHFAVCPCGESHCKYSGSGFEMTITSIIWALTDIHRWTRSQIADWV